MTKQIQTIIVVGGGTAGLLTALMLKEKYPYTKITIVKSSEIGIVGVGEGSTEHWKTFCAFVGIDIKTLIKECRATLKVGILFQNWNGDGKRYVHAVDMFSNLSSVKRHEMLNLAIQNTESEFPLSFYFQSYFKDNKVPINSNIYSVNQYHFDTHKLNIFLTKLCEQRGVSFIDGEIVDVKLSSDGSVGSLQLKSGEVVESDFYVDCSGFKRLLAKHLKVNWISKKKYLPLDSAIALPTEHDGDTYEPYTQAIALSSGWMWRIPTQDRYGNGYVFSRDYINKEQAIKEVSEVLNKNIENAREIPFEAGSLEKFWVKNCVFVGLCSSFAEPLEAQSIGFSIVQAQDLVDALEAWYLNKDYVSRKYNERLANTFQNIIDYLQAHYFTKRSDSKFWKDKPFEYTDFNKETYPLFTKGMILPTMFDSSSFFSSSNFYQVYAGLGLIDKNAVMENFNRNRPEYINNIHQTFNKHIQELKNTLPIDHKQLLNLID